MSKFDPENNIDDAAIALRRAERDVEDALARGEEARERYELAAANLKRLVDAEINRRIDEQEIE